eukprot:m.460184 g.460184  ORF g.460184 m.460184 type:complete len:372 (+) comp21590_c0_seq3:245-1360(+)
MTEVCDDDIGFISDDSNDIDDGHFQSVGCSLLSAQAHADADVSSWTPVLASTGRGDLRCTSLHELSFDTLNRNRRKILWSSIVPGLCVVRGFVHCDAQQQIQDDLDQILDQKNQAMAFGVDNFTPIVRSLAESVGDFMAGHKMRLPVSSESDTICDDFIAVAQPLEARQDPFYHNAFDRHPCFNQYIINEYWPGDGIKAHVDLLERFADGIAGISLGGPAVMTFRRAGNSAMVSHEHSHELLQSAPLPMHGQQSNLPYHVARSPQLQEAQQQHTPQSRILLPTASRPVPLSPLPPDETQQLDLLLLPGDLMCMQGDARWRWTHEIAEVDSEVWRGVHVPRGRRVSITLRRLSEGIPSGNGLAQELRRELSK